VTFDDEIPLISEIAENAGEFRAYFVSRPYAVYRRLLQEQERIFTARSLDWDLTEEQRRVALMRLWGVRSALQTLDAMRAAVDVG
jgi:hypothetical protein